MGKPTEMSCGEIARSYRAAADKKAQVKILAELNLCSQREIIEILIANGVKPQEFQRQRKKNKAPAEIVPSKKDDLIREALAMMREKIVAQIETFRTDYETIMAEYEGKLSQIDAILGKE